MGASKPEIVAGKGFILSSNVFDTIPVRSGRAPVTRVMWETAVREGIGGMDRSAKNPRSASLRYPPAGNLPDCLMRRESREPETPSKEIRTVRPGRLAAGGTAAAGEGRGAQERSRNAAGAKRGRARRNHDFFRIEKPII